MSSHRVEDRPINTKSPKMPVGAVLWDTKTLVTMLILSAIAGVTTGMLISMMVRIS